MNIEYEATFPDIDKSKSREMLKKAGATLVRREYLQKRFTLSLPDKKMNKVGWLRVRDEGNKITMSMKKLLGDKIHDQKEICLEVNNFDQAVKLLTSVGCEIKSYQETKRELWKLDGVEITIDSWPFLEPLIEVEGHSEKDVRLACEKVGLDYGQALFCAVGTLYEMKYGIPLKIINNQIPKIVFNMENPFLNNQLK
ncbi:MAG: CYTH domain-containing protein [bacterium]|nr:CYTH domain-containing protein [bacterium]